MRRGARTPSDGLRGLQSREAESSLIHFYPPAPARPPAEIYLVNLVDLSVN